MWLNVCVMNLGKTHSYHIDKHPGVQKYHDFIFYTERIKRKNEGTDKKRQNQQPGVSPNVHLIFNEEVRLVASSEIY